MTNCNYCGIEIKFDGMIRSQSGKMIPLLPNGEKHDCPKNPYKTKSSVDFNRNKQMYGGPTPQNDILERQARLETEMDGLKFQIKQLTKIVEDYGEALGEQSFKKASEVEDIDPDGPDS
jgi:hypothetical protein